MWKETTWNETLDCEGEPVLALSMALPLPEEESRAGRRIARFYQHFGALWKARWTDVLHPRACSALAEAREASRPFLPWEAELSYHITYEDDGLSSLYLDVTERRGAARPLTVRAADTWDRTTGTPLPLFHFLPPSRHWRRLAVEEVQRQAMDRLQEGESLFYEDVEERAAAHFSPRRFYLTEEGLLVFYPMWSLGSPAEGIPVFFLPDAKINPQIGPEKS